MHISDAKRFIRGIVEKQVPITVAMIGPTGIGKSAIEKQLTKELNVGFIDLRLATQEPGDVIGNPYRDGNVTRWAIPEWWPKEGTRGILCLEELNRAPQDIRQCIFQLIWDRRLHTHVLPVGWTIVLAMNPDNGDYQVESLDRALVRRCAVVVVEPHADSWMDWALKEGNVPSDIVGFIGTHKDMLFVPETFDFPVVRTPAGWGDTLSILKKSNAIPKDLEFEIIAGIVGKEAAAAYRKYMDDHYERPVAGEAVLKDYESVRERVLKQKTQQDAMYVTIKELIGLIEQTKKLGKKQMENVKDFLLDLSADMQAMFAHNLPTEIVSELGKDDRITEAVGRAMRESKEGKK